MKALKHLIKLSVKLFRDLTLHKLGGKKVVELSNGMRDLLILKVMAKDGGGVLLHFFSTLNEFVS